MAGLQEDLNKVYGLLLMRSVDMYKNVTLS